MSTLTVDLENLQLGGSPAYSIVTFPNRTKILSATFTVNPEAYGTAEQARIWSLYALASHPYDNEGTDSDWLWSLFGNSAKPVVERTDNLRYRSNTSPTGIYRQTNGTPHVFREIHEGVLAPGDYVALWLECNDGDISTISWEDTRAAITLEYEESVYGSVYENQDWYPI